MTAEALPAAEPPTFEAMNLSEPLRRAIRDAGYTAPTLVQAATFELIAAKRDVIVQSKTGSGKTAAFAIPLLDRVVTPEPFVQALTLCPTRELALQVAGEYSRLGKHRGIATTAVYGGASMVKQIEELQAGAQVVAGTPGRVLDHLRRGTMDVSRLKAIVLDEADEMLSMGFAEELNAILEFIPKQRQGLLFSATMPESIQRMARRHLKDPQLVTLSSDNVAPSEVTHYAYFVSAGSSAKELARIMEVEKPDATIVFCNTKDETVVVAKELQRLGLKADWLNGDLAQNDRERVMGSFRAQQIQYLVATDVAARGIDVSNVSHVINFGFPDSPEQYVHRTGRTGRAGRRGTAISLVGPHDIGNLYFLRLTYGIRPIERSLPSAGEERTRRELDRLNLLREAFTEEPGEEAIALGRRVLVHEDAEKIIASLVMQFFNLATKQAIAQGIGKVSSGPPRAAPAPRNERNERPAPRPAPEPRAERPASRPAVAPEVPASAGPPGAAPVAQAAIMSAVPPAAAQTDATTEPPHERREPRPRAETGSRAKAPERPRRIDVPGEGALDEEGPEPGMDEMRIAVGRRDGVRPGDLAREIRERAQLDRRDVGRIFVRDRFTLVNIRAEFLDRTLEAMKDVTLGEKLLSPERGKSVNPSLPPPASRGADGEENTGPIVVPAAAGVPSIGEPRGEE